MLAEMKRNPPTQSAGSSSSPQSQNSEVGKYLNTRWVQLYKTNVEVLKWWKDNQLMFPILLRFTHDVISTPVSTISFESTFSTPGRILDDWRISLKTDMLEMLTVVKEWEMVDRRAQETAKNSEEFIDYFKILYV